MRTAYQQIAFKLETREYDMFKSFAKRLDMSPYTVIRHLVKTWAAADSLARRVEEGKANDREAFSDLGNLVEGARLVSQVNVAFQDALKQVVAHYGVVMDPPTEKRDGVLILRISQICTLPQGIEGATSSHGNGKAEERSAKPLVRRRRIRPAALRAPRVPAPELTPSNGRQV